MLCGSETWPVKEEDMIRLERNDTRMVGRMSIMRSENRISAENLRSRLKLSSVRECFQEKRLQWFHPLERMEKNAWSSNCRIFKVSDSFPRRLLRKTWNEVIRGDLKERENSKDLAKGGNAWKSFIRNRPTNESMKNRH